MIGPLRGVRVRTQWMALAAALVVLAAVVVAWALGEVAHRVAVLQVVRAVEAGAPIDALDLAVAEVAFDPTVDGLMPASAVDDVVGQAAAFDLRPGMLLQRGMWHDLPMLEQGEHSVGAVLAPGSYPGDLVAGRHAFAVALAGDAESAPPVAVAVRVLEAHVHEDGSLSVTLAVGAAEAAVIAEHAATGRLALVGVPTTGGTP